MRGSRLVIGSRGSKLALWQANHIKSRLTQRHFELEVALEIIRTTGDKITDVALSRVGGKGLFTKEIEEALFDRRVDIAVHSLKDLPTALPDGLIADVITERLHGADALVSRRGLKLADLPGGARLGTGSLRRKVQIAALRPDLVFMDLRGNVDTRLAKLERGEYDAVVLAQAGLVRLGLEGRITELLDPDQVVPAAGQGALAVEYRQGDDNTSALVSFLTDP
ncbi:MAG: hydroxymethylbilane synthase, partial [Candidatus Glassbacteria bacterium]